MEKENEGFRLNLINAFSLHRINNLNNFETGLSATFGFELHNFSNKIIVEILIFQWLKLLMKKITKNAFKIQA